MPAHHDRRRGLKTQPLKNRRRAHQPPPPIVQEIKDLTKTWKARLGLWPKPNGSNLTLASDCSGYGSELLALRLLGQQTRVKPVMFCENSPSKSALHAAMSDACGFDARACTHVKNIFKRNNNEAPRADLYCAGFPCPPWSRLGKGRGAQDERGMVTLQGLLYIATRRPRAVVLEQVAALLDKSHRQVWVFLQQVLRDLDYDVTFQIVNTRDYGIPQSRPRVYIVAICKESVTKPFVFPAKRDKRPDLHLFLDKTKRGTERLDLPHYEAKLGPSVWTQGYVLDVAASKKFQHPMRNCAPCLTKTRCKQHGYYIPKLQRRLSSVEMARLQGLPAAVHEALATTVADKGLPDRSVEEAIGDAMSINILQTLLRRCCESAGLLSLPRQKDFWLDCPADKCHQLSDALWAKYR